MSDSPRRISTPVRRRALVPLAALAAAVTAACGHVIAPPPPATPPQVSEVATLQGHPAVVAAKAARTLQARGWTTKRFGSDSTWGWLKADSAAARIRYTHPSEDSTRILVELWGRCPPNARCRLRGELGALLMALEGEDSPPQ